MLETLRNEASPPQLAAAALSSLRSDDRQEDDRASRRVADNLRLLTERLAPRRRVVHAGDVVFAAGDRFDTLYVLTSGFFKLVNLAADGREQVVSLKFRGDWLGFDGIATGRHGCDAVAMDTGEVWRIRYDALLQACLRRPELLAVLHEAMSREIVRDRDTLLSLNTLPADARVAEFLRWWTDTLAERGLRNDHITLPLTRAEIGNYLGMTLESVSRALSRLARGDVIRFPEKGRRDIQIPEVGALAAFVARRMATGAPALLQ
jgi:CRP/FNR family transcriptional regulator, anaerobic regulatory protein